MKLLKALAGGLAGSIVLTGIHQLLRKHYDDAPRMDLLGEEVISKGYRSVGAELPSEEKLHKMALIGDIITNTLYFGIASASMSSSKKGVLLGLAAGAGALYLPEKMGLNPEHSNRTIQTKVLTVAMYMIGGMVAGKLIDKMSGE